MASESDNPFARNSAWPQMPQAPFRVGPLPKARPAPDSPPPEPARQTVTPVFTRPTGPAAFSGLPAATPSRPAPAAAPPAAVEPVPAAAPPAEQAAEAAEPPVAPPQPYIEVAPVIVQPLGAGRRAAPRRSPLPAAAAGVAGLAAVLGIAYALSRGQEASLKAPPAPPPAAIAEPPAAAVAPTPQPTVEAPAEVVSAKVAATPPAPTRTRPPRRITPPAPEATGDAPSAPLLTLPPPAVVSPTPQPQPQPTYAPPPAPDPNAPVSTRRD